MKTKFVIGTTDPLEIAAIRDACGGFGLDAEIIAACTLPCLYATPLGYVEIAIQASQIAVAALDTLPNAGCLSVGIQNGVVTKDGRGYQAIDCIVVRSSAETRLESWWTEPTAVPRMFVRELFRRGVTRTTLTALAERLSDEPVPDVYRYLTGGQVTRHQRLSTAFAVILGKMEKRGLIGK